MFIKTLYLYRFRHFDEAHFEFSPRFNLLCGPNAQGKTTILEAIHYLMMGRSFRPVQSAELIKHGAPGFYIEAKFSKHGVDQTLKIGFDGKERKIIYNHTTLPSVSSLLGILLGVTMSPDDINLIKGTPQLRRQFLDIQIAQADPLYVHHLTRYVRAMKQRNQLLKVQQKMTIETWEQEMGQSAAYLNLQRHGAVHELKAHCLGAYQKISAEENSLSIGYRAPLTDPMTLSGLRDHHLSQWNKHRSREMMLGYTLTGPHKDDLDFILDGKEIRNFASEGQQRSFVTAVRLAEWERLQQKGEEQPLLMLDDVGISLDLGRRQRLLERLTTAGQVFLTTTDENLLDSIQEEKKIFHIKRVALSRAS